MQITEHTAGDIERLKHLIDRETRAKRRDNLRITLLAFQRFEKFQFAEVMGIAKSTVEYWAYAYRDRGIEALQCKSRSGRPRKIAGDQARLLKERIDAGPTACDGVCTLRAKDIQRIVRDELGVSVGLSSVYRTLERMGYSCLAPRPRHEKQDLAAQNAFKDTASPLF